MYIDDKSAGNAYQALGDLADALAVSVEAMTRIAIALQPNKPTVPGDYVSDVVTMVTSISRTLTRKD